MRYLLLTGMSGAGKTLALRALEDMGAFCVDNLPPQMIPGLMESCEAAAMAKSVAAFSVDVRSGASFDSREVSLLLQEVRDVGRQMQIIFLEAGDEVLTDRFKESRREHPLSGDGVSLPEAIDRERMLLQPLREAADYLIDTSEMKPRALTARLREIYQESGGGRELPLRAEVISFGFKRGIPRQADLVLDVRFLPNPFYIPALSRQTGQDEEVRRFVLDHPVTEGFLRREEELLGFLLPHYREEGKKRLVVAVGCTGGQHRSVAIAEALGKWLEENGCLVEVRHRDMELEKARWQNQ